MVILSAALVGKKWWGNVIIATQVIECHSALKAGGGLKWFKLLWAFFTCKSDTLNILFVLRKEKWLKRHKYILWNLDIRESLVLIDIVIILGNRKGKLAASLSFGSTLYIYLLLFRSAQRHFLFLSKHLYGKPVLSNRL